jgi:glycosyltransferase involved in cell wall biosynthesis
MISTDRALFDGESAVRARLIEQAALVSHIDVVVFTPKGMQYTLTKVDKHLSLHPTSSVGKWAYLSDAYRIAKTILKARNQKDKWLITTQDPFFTGAIGYLLSRTFDLPLHLQLHTDPWSKEWQSEQFSNKFKLTVAMYLLRNAAGVRVVSERVEQSVLALGVPRERVTRIPIFVDVKHFLTAKANFDLHRSYPLFSRIILTIGRLEHEKNYSKLIRAFKEVHRVYDDTMLMIVGSGSERERLLSLARSLSLEDAVVILPWARDVASYYKSADLYVQPSLYEGWGMAVIEAMASGLPVVMTDVGCAGEVLKNDVSGIVVSASDEASLSSAMLRLLSDKELAKRLISSAKEEVKKLATSAETLALYKKSWEDAANAFKPKESHKHGTQRKA